jgi:hypothetical protein
MRHSLLFGFGLACVSIAGMAETIETDATFSRYFGDATPVGIPSLQTFINGVQVVPSVPANVINGVEQGELALPAGTTSVEFKAGDGVSFNLASLVSWTPAVSQEPTAPDGTFKFGTFTITNGIFFFQANFDMTFTTVSTDPAFNGRTFSDSLSYIVTPNNGVSTFDDADYIELANHPDLSPPQVRIDEGTTGTVDLYGRVGSLDPLFFANPTGGVQLAAPVPEPSEWLLMLTGMAATLWLVRRRRYSGSIPAALMT